MERPARPGQLEQGGLGSSTQNGLPLTFELLAEIATGPTARVELCRVRQPKELAGRLVAVKRLHPHIAEDPQFYSMFVDEVWMTAALDHPNITHVAGWGTDAEGTYLAVELVEGVSLARLMKTVFETREAFTERMVVYLGSEMCAGLSAAHALRSSEGELLNLVHRDLTPGNVLLGFDGRVLIADFGLAKAKQRVTKTLTGLLKGHPQYMAPEQATEKAIDGRSDLFSLGVVLFELFTGRHPWSGGTEVEMFQMMATEPPADISTLRPKIDPELASTVHRLLARDPAARFSNADELRQRLLYWLDAHGYKDDNLDAVARFVRRNAMRQMRWFERAVAGDFVAEATRAKSRLLGARARSQGGTQSRLRSQPPQAGTATGSKGSQVGRPAAVRENPSRRRAAVRRVTDEATDVSDMGARIQERPSSETPDWGEEVPTVVKPNTQLPAYRRAAVRGPAPEAPEAPDTDTAADALPSFVDDEEDSSEDNRTTSVKPQVMLDVHAKLRRDAAAREAASREPTTPGGRTAASFRAMVQDMPTLVDPDSDSNEVPTSPLRQRPQHIDGVPLRKLPPPRREVTSSGQSEPPRRESMKPILAGAAAEPPSQMPGHAEGAAIVARTRAAMSPSGMSEQDLSTEAERLGQIAARLRGEADQAAKVAAHRAVLAQLASEAAALATEAARSVMTHGHAHAAGLVEEARRLEASIARGEAQTQSLQNAAPDLREAPSPNVPQAAPTQVMPHREPYANLASHPPMGFQGLPTQPLVTPGAAAQGLPIPSGSAGFAASDGDRPSYTGAGQTERISYAPADPRKEATAATRYRLGDVQRDDMFAGEVFGVRVPVALAAALLIAVAMVVLVWIMFT